MKAKKITTSVTVTANDILNLGFDYYCDEEGIMSFAIGFDEHSGISEILLRNVLKCYGDYEIVGHSEYDEEEPDEYGNSTTYEIYHTNLPKGNFTEVVGENVRIYDLFCIEEELYPAD